MRTLAGVNTRLDSEIRSLEQTNPFQKIATESQLDKLFAKMRGQIPVSIEIPSETKRKVIQALVHQVVITKEGFKMHFYVGVDQIKKGEQWCSPMKSLQKEISVPGSLKDLNGGSPENRTRTPLRILDFESSASTNSTREPHTLTEVPHFYRALFRSSTLETASATPGGAINKPPASRTTDNDSARSTDTRRPESGGARAGKPRLNSTEK